jgi:hypothetical protein
VPRPAFFWALRASSDRFCSGSGDRRTSWQLPQFDQSACVDEKGADWDSNRSTAVKHCTLRRCTDADVLAGCVGFEPGALAAVSGWAATLDGRLAVPDGLTHQPIYPLSPATAETAVAGWETCAHRAANLPPGRRSDMSPTSHDSLARGHRVREFVCAYRTLRDDQGQPVRLSTKALSDPRIAAVTLAPLLASETVEVFAVASSPRATNSSPGTCSPAARARAHPFRFRTCSCPRA